MSVGMAVEDGIAVITIDRPEKMNALTREMYDSINTFLRELDADSRVRAGVITGAGGRAFSAGADLGDAHDAASSGRGSWRPADGSGHTNGLRGAKPLIAAIEGYCLAGGLELALFCDFRIASRSAQFGIPEVRWNLIAGYGAAVLPGIVGLSNALYLLLTGERIDVEEAKRIGLVQEIVGEGRALERALELAKLVAGHGPMAVRMTKELAMTGSEDSSASVRASYAFYALLNSSEDTEEGTRAFLEKRAPHYKDR